MPTIQERMDSLWHSRRIGKPYEIGNQVCINVYSAVLDRNLENNQEYVTAESVNQAAKLILDYYGRVENSTAVQSGIALGDIFFPARDMSNPILKMVVGKELVEDSNEVVGDTQNYSLLMTKKQIADFKDTINTLFPVYQQQLKFFDGSITPNINFLDLQDKVGLFFQNLTSFIEFNGYSANQYDKIGVKFGTSDFMVKSVMIQREETNNLLNIPLVNGVKFYFESKKEGSNKYVNELVQNINSIMFDSKMKINWTQFVYEYLSGSGVSINFYGKPRTETEASKANKKAKEGPWGPLAATDEEVKAIRKSIDNRDVQVKAFEEARKAIQETNQTLQARLQKIVQEIEAISDGFNDVRNILNKYNVTTLIEAALECLLFKAGFNGAVPDFLPGFNPFEPQLTKPNFRLPEIPTKLPVISINKVLQVQVRENLKRAAISAAMSAIQTVAMLIKQFCLRQDNDSLSEPAQEVVGKFLDPLQPENALLDCYRDYNFIVSSPELFEIPAGLTESDILESYLTDLSPLITPRELCDLFNNVASDDVLQVANNLIEVSWPQLRQNFADGEAIQSFFACLGNLVDPSYCEGVYNDLSQYIPEIDPCTIEDSQPYQDIVELLDNIGDLYENPDMACGAGIVPPLAEIESYNNSVTRMIDSVVATIQQIFVNDLGNFKESVVVPKPLDPADQRRLEELRSVLQFLQPPPEPEVDLPDDIKGFFDNLIPEQVIGASDDFKNIHNALTSQARGEVTDNIKELLASRDLLVAPGTRDLYQRIEDNFLSQADRIDNPLQDASRFYSFSTSLNYASAITGRDILYSMRALSSQEDNLDIFTTPLSYSDSQEKEKILDISLFQNQLGQDTIRREFLARNFSEEMFEYFQDYFSGASEQSALLEDLSIRKLFPYFYFGLINSLAYKVSVSDLFNAETMRSLNLFPKLCQDGSISNSDLLDVNSIKQSALQEFVDNSCIDREFELGPVRDAAVQAIVELYMQVVIVDLVLKNIFMTSKFGIDYVANSETIVNELLTQTTEILRSPSLNLSISYNKLPKIVKRAAAMIVKKVINRSFEPNAAAFVYPISGELPVSQQQFIDSNNFEPSGVSLDDAELQNIATQYFFEKRLIGTTDKIKEFFNVPGNSYIENYLHNGVQFVDMAQMDDTGPFLAAEGALPGIFSVGGGNTEVEEFFTKYNYVDKGREVYDLYYSQPNTSDAWISFSGSISQQRIEKEVDAFLKYGTFVAEKYFEVEFSPSGLEESEYSDPVKSAISSFFDELEPSTMSLDKEVQTVSINDNTPEPDSTYLLNFEKFAELLNTIVALTATDQQLASNRITAYLTGYNLRANDSSNDNLPTPRRVPFQIRLGRRNWDDSGPRSMSDYTLIRSWWKALNDGLNIYWNENKNPQKFDIFSPLNSSIPDFSKEDRGALESYSISDVDSGTHAGAGTRDRETKTILQSRGNKPSLGLFFNAKLFEGKSFGYENFSTRLNELKDAWESGQTEPGRTYIIAESKSLIVVATTEQDRGSNTFDVGDQVFYIGFRLKNHDGTYGRTYSSIDFWDGNEDNVEFSTVLYSTLEDIFDEFENEEALLTAFGLSSSESGLNVVNINEFEDSEQESLINLDQIREVFPSIQMKARMVYITPEDQSMASGYFSEAGITNNDIKSEKTFYRLKNDDSSGRHIATNYDASTDFYSENALGGEALIYFRGAVSMINNVYDLSKSSLVQQLSAKLQPLMAPGQSVDLMSVLQYLYITGEIKTFYDLFAAQDIFTDTKAVLVLALQAAFGSEEDSPCDVSALQNALLSGANRAVAPIASVGQSFLNKMLKETPKYILKGVVEMTEPHVIVSKKVKEVSGGVFQKIKMAEDMATPAGLPDAAAGIAGQSSECGPDIPGGAIDLNAPDIDLSQIPNLQEIISAMQEEVDRAYPPGFPNALKPSITEKGIDLEGTIPYTFFVPPLTPFGIIYLLLRLSELGQQELQVEEDCADQ